MNLDHPYHQHEHWVRGYTHFLLFFVIFSLVLTYSIILGVGWGTLVAVVTQWGWDVFHGGTISAPAITVLISEAVRLFIAGLTLHSLAALTYDRDTGYRIRYPIGSFAGRTICLLVLMTGGFVAVRPFLGVA